MAKFIVDMPDGWSMEDPCFKCPFEQEYCTFPDNHCCLPKYAKEAVEVEVVKTGDGYYSHAITGRKKILYAVKEAK